MIGGFPSADVPMHTVRQVLVALLDEAIKELSQGAPSDRVVHAIREKLKRARAALRLLRPCIGAQAYHQQNLLIRDAARPLTMVRDADVLLQTLRSLELEAASKKADAAVDKADAFSRLLHRELRRERIEERRRLSKRELHDEAAALRLVKRRIESISGARLDQAALGTALERTYKAGREAYAQVMRRSTDERLHEWRKQTKYLLAELDIVSPLNSDKFAKRRKRARRLGRRLGDDHDLAVLNRKIFQYAKGPNAASQNAAVEELLSRLARRRKVLQDEARRLGRLLYSAKAGDMRKKFDKSLRAPQQSPRRAQGQ